MTPDPLPKVPLKSLRLGSRALLYSLAGKRLGLRQPPLGSKERRQIVEACQSIRVVVAESGLTSAQATQADCTDCIHAQEAQLETNNGH